MRRSMLIPLALATIAMTPYAPDAPQYFPIVGGSGGSGFTRSCGAGKVLTGFFGRTGMWVDAIGVLCRPVSASGTLGAESTVGSAAGGTGGTSTSVSCASGTVVSGIFIRAGSFVNSVSITCRKWDAATRKFGGPLPNTNPGIGRMLTGGSDYTQNCELTTQPVNGVRGRAAAAVDALGAICNEP